MTENVTNVAKYLTKLKETMNYVWEKISSQKAVRIKFSVNSAFSNMFYYKKTKTWKSQKSTESFLNQKSTQC